MSSLIRRLSEVSIEYPSTVYRRIEQVESINGMIVIWCAVSISCQIIASIITNYAISLKRVVIAAIPR